MHHRPVIPETLENAQGKQQKSIRSVAEVSHPVYFERRESEMKFQSARMISVNGRSLGIEGQEDILYLDIDAFRVCVATTEVRSLRWSSSGDLT